MGRLLCWLGLHRWRGVTRYGGLVRLDRKNVIPAFPYKQTECERCRIAQPDASKGER